MSKWKSRVFPGKALEGVSQTRLTSTVDALLCGDEGETRLAERETTSFNMFKASFQCAVWSHRNKHKTELRYSQRTHSGTCSPPKALHTVNPSSRAVAVSSSAEINTRPAREAVVQRSVCVCCEATLKASVMWTAANRTDCL